MKGNLLFFLFLISNSLLNSQELFTEDFLLNLPFPLITIENQMYVGLFQTDDDRPSGISRLSYDNPDNIEAIYDNEQFSQGPLYLALDTENNNLYGTLLDLFYIDLDGEFPTTEETFIDTDGIPVLVNNGLTYHQGFIYFYAGEGDIYRIDANANENTELVYNVPNVSNLVITHILNNELYYFKYNNAIGVDLVKIDIINPEEEILVSNNNAFVNFVQSSHIVNNTMFVGLDSNTSNPSVYRYDLTQELPLNSSPVSESIIAGPVLGITTFENDLYFSESTGRNIFRVNRDVLTTSTENREVFKIYPNPVSDRVFLTREITTPLEYKIYNTEGKVISNGLYTASGITTSSLPKGVYLVELSSVSGASAMVEIFKLIKN